MFERVQLKNLCTVNQGLQIPISKRKTEPGDDRYFYITVQFLKNNSENFYIENPPVATTCTEDEILMVRTGNTGQVITGVKGCFHNNFFKVKPNERLNSKYLYYVLKSEEMYKRILNAASGTTIPDLKHSSFYALDIPVPDMEIQIKIASILSVIDKKIETNTHINRNLSEQAAALYKSWFVDYEPFNGEKPLDWIDGTVDELGNEVVCGKTPSTKNEEYYGDDVPFVTIPDMHGCVYSVHTERKLSILGAESQSKKTLPKNSICISCIGTAGLVVLLSEPSQTNQQINSIIPKDNYSPYYIYLMMKTMGETINKLGQAGSTIVNLNKTQFGKMNVLIPSIKSMMDFDEIVEPMFKSILSNQIENTKLVNLRDSLLPKLMAGELDVSDLDI